MRHTGHTPQSIVHCRTVINRSRFLILIGVADSLKNFILQYFRPQNFNMIRSLSSRRCLPLIHKVLNLAILLYQCTTLVTTNQTPKLLKVRLGQVVRATFRFSHSFVGLPLFPGCSRIFFLLFFKLVCIIFMHYFLLLVTDELVSISFQSLYHSHLSCLILIGSVTYSSVLQFQFYF